MSISWLDRSIARFSELRAKYAGQTFLVLGNGPSLDQVAAGHMSKCVTIACNNAWRMRTKWGRDAELTLITDRARLGEFQKEDPSLDSQLVLADCYDVVPSPRRWKYFQSRDAIVIRQLMVPFFRRHPALIPLTRIDLRVFDLVCEKRDCSFDFGTGFCLGHSVVIPGIQMAVALGASRVLLAGVDARAAGTNYFSMMPGNVRVDPNFLNNPRAKIEPYLALLRAHMDPLGVALIDCSAGGALTSVERSSLNELL